MNYDLVLRVSSAFHSREVLLTGSPLHAGLIPPAVKKEINAVIKQHLDRHLL
jgi:hypothetical protein